MSQRQKTAPTLIHGIGFNAREEEPGWWQIVTNMPFQHAWPVADRIYGDVEHIKGVLREWGDMYLAGRPQQVKPAKKTKRTQTRRQAAA